jgi:hypothetical protein
MLVKRNLVFLGLAFSCVAVHAQTADQLQKATATGVIASGSNARVATDLCQFDKNRVESYKVAQKQVFAVYKNFESDWTAGWQQGQVSVASYTKLKSTNAREFEQTKSDTCSGLAEDMKP